MTDWTMQSTERDLSEMLGAYLRRRTPSAKHLARQIGCDPRTAEGFRAGRHWPQAKHWMGIVAAFGRDVTDAVFHPDVAAARLQEEIAQLEAELAERRAALGVVGTEARSFTSRHSKAGARDEDRAAALSG
jgi:hypothetical protein